MGNWFSYSISSISKSYIYTRTYDNQACVSSCDVVIVTNIDDREITRIYKIMKKKMGVDIRNNRKKIKACLKYVCGQPDIMAVTHDIGYYIFRLKSRPILKVENVNAAHFFDSIGQKWNFIDFNLDKIQ